VIVKRFKTEEEKKVLISHVASEWDLANGFYTTPRMRDKYFYPLTDPKCVPAEEADFMLDTDHVVGIYHKGKARAYPLYIMDYFHHLNDIIEGDPLVFST
jgi:hypothetical protein